MTDSIYVVCNAAPNVSPLDEDDAWDDIDLHISFSHVRTALSPLSIASVLDRDLLILRVRPDVSLRQIQNAVGSTTTFCQMGVWDHFPYPLPQARLSAIAANLYPDKNERRPDILLPGSHARLVAAALARPAPVEDACSFQIRHRFPGLAKGCYWGGIWVNAIAGGLPDCVGKVRSAFPSTTLHNTCYSFGFCALPFSEAAKFVRAFFANRDIPVEVIPIPDATVPSFSALPPRIREDFIGYYDTFHNPEMQTGPCSRHGIAEEWRSAAVAPDSRDPTQYQDVTLLRLAFNAGHVRPEEAPVRQVVEALRDGHQPDMIASCQNARTGDLYILVNGKVWLPGVAFRLAAHGIAADLCVPAWAEDPHIPDMVKAYARRVSSRAPTGAATPA